MIRTAALSCALVACVAMAPAVTLAAPASNVEARPCRGGKGPAHLHAKGSLHMHGQGARPIPPVFVRRSSES